MFLWFIKYFYDNYEGLKLLLIRWKSYIIQLLSNIVSIMNFNKYNAKEDPKSNYWWKMLKDKQKRAI